MRLIESFVSINGEGIRAGELSAFIRFKGCNLNCSYCDTKYANAEDAEAVEVSPAELVQWADELGIRNVTLTGGEPLCQGDILELAELLMKSGHKVEFETNGSVFIGNVAKMNPRPLITMDYKLPSSGMESEMVLENFEHLDRGDVVKFVAGCRGDLERAYQIIEEYRLIEKCHVYFSPVFGKIDPADIVEFMASHKMNGVRLQIQMHKIIWNPERRGV